MMRIQNLLAAATLTAGSAMLMASCEIVSGIEPTVLQEDGADAAPVVPALDAGPTLDAGPPSDAGPTADAGATCSDSTCVAGPCEVARCEGSECVIESACTDGEVCCAGTCVPVGCDDGNPCTDDVCGQDGCEHEPNTASCEDGTFCNGPDTCADGACSVHAGDPCEGSTVCNEDMRTCVGCLGDADCPDQTLGAWGECEGFDDLCDLTGTHSRSVITYACVDNVCIPNSSTETEACTRSTDGITCDSTSFGAWSGCGGFSGICDESGSQSRARTDFVCSAGSCTAVDTSETRSCGRDQDGETCDDPVTGAWSTCGGYTSDCDESGTKSREIRTPICSNGTCSDESVSTESRSCSRNTDGDTCDTVYGDWSACGGFSSYCDETGIRSRTVTTMTCESGGCSNAASQMTQSQSCTRDRDGKNCVVRTSEHICEGYCSSGSCGDFFSCEPEPQ